jgi:hypothetical protein
MYFRQFLHACVKLHLSGKLARSFLTWALITAFVLSGSGAWDGTTCQCSLLTDSRWEEVLVGIGGLLEHSRSTE